MTDPMKPLLLWLFVFLPSLIMADEADDMPNDLPHVPQLVRHLQEHDLVFGPSGNIRVTLYQGKIETPLTSETTIDTLSRQEAFAWKICFNSMQQSSVLAERLAEHTTRFAEDKHYPISSLGAFLSDLHTAIE